MNKLLFSLALATLTVASCRTHQPAPFELLSSTRLVEKAPLSNITGLTVVNDTAAVIIADNRLHLYQRHTGQLLTSFGLNDKIVRAENWLLLNLDTAQASKVYAQREEIGSHIAAPRIVAPVLKISDSVIAVAYEYYLPGAIRESNDTAYIDGESRYFIAQYAINTGKIIANNPVKLYFKDEFQSLPDIAFGYQGGAYFMGGFQYRNPQHLPTPLAVPYRVQGKTLMPQTPTYIAGVELEAGAPHKYSISNGGNRSTLALRNAVYDLESGKAIYSLDSAAGRHKEVMYHALLSDGVYVLYGVLDTTTTFEYYEALVSGGKSQSHKLADRSIVDIYRDTCYKITKSKHGVFLEAYFLH